MDFNVESWFSFFDRNTQDRKIDLLQKKENK